MEFWATLQRLPHIRTSMKVDPDAFDPLACRPVLSEPQTVDDKENPFITDVHAGSRNLKSGDLPLLRLNQNVPQLDPQNCAAKVGSFRFELKFPSFYLFSQPLSSITRAQERPFGSEPNPV